MAEETSNTVKTTSDGNVKITVERYQELLDKAAAKPATIVHRTVHKTPEISAAENKAWGVSFMGLGAAFMVVGIIRFRAGVVQAARLK